MESQEEIVVLNSDSEETPVEPESSNNPELPSSARRFIRGHKEKYTLHEKRKLGQLISEKKKKYDSLVIKKSKDGYLASAVREYYQDLSSLKSSDPMLQKAIKMGKRSYEQYVKDSNDISDKPSNKKIRAEGGGRKTRVQNVREAAFEWFIDVRTSLKARLPRSQFKLKCIELYKAWLSSQSEEVKAEEMKNPMVFSNRWIHGWMREYRVSLRKPNKRYQIKAQDRKERIVEYIKNVWRVRKFFIDRYGVDPPIINGDQMPLHRNESQ